MKLEDVLETLSEDYCILEDIVGGSTVEFQMPGPNFIKALYPFDVSSIRVNGDGYITIAIKDDKK